MLRGIRGAILVKNNTKSAIFSSTKRLLRKMVGVNKIEINNIASIFLTATVDLNAEFPASAVRQMGWREVRLLCAQEIDVPSAMRRVVRALIHVNTNKSQKEVKHLYIGEAKSLRPDLRH